MSGIPHFDHKMSDAEGLMWRLEKDPYLSSTFANVTVLDKAPDMDRLRARLERATHVIPRLRQRVQPVPANLTAPMWVEDPNFDLHYHVRHVALPKPGTMRQLLDLAALVAGDAFDRTRPLWQFVVVDGLRGGKSALIQKLHHTIIDGEGGVRMKDGQPLKVTLWTQSDSIFRRLTEVVQAELKAVGIEAKITTFDSSTIKDEFKSGNQQLAVRSYFWPNADIVDWFFSAERLGYPNTSMFNDPKAEELRVKAMTGSATQEERIANFTAYHEYVTRQFPYAPIYQPVQNMAYNIDRIEMPAEIHATQITGVVMVDVKVKE